MKNQVLQTVTHEFQPVYDRNSRILILGSFPSVKSREGRFYYHHPRNRFWPVLSALTHSPLPLTVSEKTILLLNHGIALWDVVAQCDIAGSSDSSICNVIPADLPSVLRDSQIQAIFTNGGTAHRLYKKYCRKSTGIEDICLPSTSPANAAYSLEKLIAIWGEQLSEKFLEKF